MCWTACFPARPNSMPRRICALPSSPSRRRANGPPSAPPMGALSPARFHVDTGINRLGFSPAAFEALIGDARSWRRLNLTLLMSHLACADEPAIRSIGRQRHAFAAVRAAPARHPGEPRQFERHFPRRATSTHDLVRPGIALYGGNPIAPPAQSHAAGCPSRRRRCSRLRDVAGRRERRLWRNLAGAAAHRASRSLAPATRTACRARSVRAPATARRRPSRRPALPGHRACLDGYDGDRRHRCAASTLCRGAHEPKSSAAISPSMKRQNGPAPSPMNSSPVWASASRGYIRVANRHIPEARTQ